MCRRLGLVVVAVAVIFAGVTICTAKEASCAVMKKANHDCCKNRSAFSSVQCCCQDSDGELPVLGANDSEERRTIKSLHADAFAVTLGPAHLHEAADHGTRYHGLAPSQTPVTRHILLLL